MAEVDVEVVVMGGGVAGCSVLHRLLAGGMPGNRIALIERLPELGGVARSSAIPNTGHDGRSDLPTEYSWRVLGGDYVVVRSILRDIPDPEPVSDALARSWKEKQQSQTQSQRHGTAPLPRTALANWDTLPDPWMVGTTVVRDDADDEQDSVVTEELPQMASVKDASLWSSAPFLRRLSMVQTVRLWWRVLYGFSACRARRSVELSRVSWYDYMDADELPVRPRISLFALWHRCSEQICIKRVFRPSWSTWKDGLPWRAKPWCHAVRLRMLGFGHGGGTWNLTVYASTPRRKWFVWTRQTSHRTASVTSSVDHYPCRLEAPSSTTLLLRLLLRVLLLLLLRLRHGYSRPIGLQVHCLLYKRRVSYPPETDQGFIDWYAHYTD